MEIREEGRTALHGQLEKIEIGVRDSAWSVREATIMALQEQNERAPLSSLLEARLDDDTTIRQAAEATLDEHAYQHEGPKRMGQKLNPDSWVRILSAWWRLLFAAFSVGILFFLMPQLFYAYGIESYSMIIMRMVMLLIFCLALVSLNLLVQRKSFSALLRFQQGGGRPASPWPWMGVALAILSIIALVSQAGIIESGFDYSSAADINMYHIAMICRIIALGVVAMTMLLINRIFRLK